eukprot:TRINITY_DN8789_c0_g1_i6.p1 TRINITY_DN8789_c0_g1~~TRINITY_DN8789_c0_g1_i6.p1  ORF type:complete len:344 (-),score=56.78 TRINITY_DN8789_c0_g1_i6:131-1117(-)
MCIRDRDKAFGGVTSVFDLKGKKILAINNGIYEKLIRNFGGIPVIYPLFTEIPDAVVMFKNKTDIRFMMWSTIIIDFQTVKDCELYKVLDGVSDLMIQTTHPFRVSDDYIRKLDIAGINATGTKTSQKYYKEYVDKWDGEKCQDKEEVNKERVTYSDVKEVFYILAGALVIGLFLTIFSKFIGQKVHFWRNDNLAGRRYFMLFDGITAMTNRYLISSMVRLHEVSRPKNAYYFAHISKIVNPLLLSKATKSLREEQLSKKITFSGLSLNQIERSSFSAFEIAICGKIIRSTSQEKKESLKGTLYSNYTKRKWIDAILFFVIPCQRWKF